MTYTPADLLAVRKYLIGALNLAPGPTAADLEADEVGVVGDDQHPDGYHVGNDALVRVGKLTTDYSKRESPRDRPGSNAASALDIGDFRRGTLTLRSLSVALVAACQRGDPRCGDIREIIYSPDGVVVRRWDRLGVRTTGDLSHRYHTHLSFFRDSEGRRAQANNILGLLADLITGARTESATVPTPAGDTMDVLLKLGSTSAPDLWLANGATRTRIPTPVGERRQALHRAGILPLGNGGNVVVEPGNDPTMLDAYGIDVDGRDAARDTADQARDAAQLAAVNALGAAIEALATSGTSVDTAAILARMNEIAATESATVTQLRTDITTLRQRLAAAKQAEATSLNQP